MIIFRPLAVNLLLVLSVAHAQDSDTTYRVTLSGGAGYSRFFSTVRQDGLNKGGIAATLRLMWAPEHRLSVGVQSGYQLLYTLSGTLPDGEPLVSSVRATLSTVPLMLVVAMRITGNLQLRLGSGGLLLFSRLDAFGSRTATTQWSTGNLAGVSYSWPLAAGLQLGAEATYIGIHKLDNGSAAIQATLAYDLFRY